MQVIYKNGDTAIKTTITDGMADYTDGMTAEDYIDTLPDDYEIWDLGSAADQIEIHNTARYIGEWQEITESEWWEYYECLPPEKCQTVDGVYFFRMMEYLTGNITNHFARIDGRYFQANRRTTDSYQVMADEIKKALFAPMACSRHTNRQRQSLI